MSGKRRGWSGVTWHSEGSKVLGEMATAYPPPPFPLAQDAPQRSTRAFDALRQGATPAPVGPVEAEWIRTRWRALGGHFLVERPNTKPGNVHNAVISEAELFTAVRAGKIRL